MNFDSPLPIDEALPALTAALRASNTAVLVAPPGAGKTTRVPLVLADEPWAKGGKVLVLEPRRIAARAAADRMAKTLGRAHRRDGRPARALRLEGVGQDPHRGHHRGRVHATDPRRSRIEGGRGGAVRRIPRALARCGPWARACARRPAGPARGPENPSDVGDHRRRARRRAARQRADDRVAGQSLSSRHALRRPRSARAHRGPDGGRGHARATRRARLGARLPAGRGRNPPHRDAAQGARRAKYRRGRALRRARCRYARSRDLARSAGPSQGRACDLDRRDLADDRGRAHRGRFRPRARAAL